MRDGGDAAALHLEHAEQRVVGEVDPTVGHEVSPTKLKKMLWPPETIEPAFDWAQLISALASFERIVFVRVSAETLSPVTTFAPPKVPAVFAVKVQFVMLGGA
ncbi:MAG: hypothetical protein U0842_02535 [Candidatus Binatia bacterium]